MKGSTAPVNNHRFSFVLPAALANDVAQIAYGEMLSVNAWLRRAVNRAVKEQLKETDAQQR